MTRKPLTLGKYQVRKKVGSGSMGDVYLAYDPFIDRDVAIKVAKPRIVGEGPKQEHYHKPFFHEARIAGMLDHRFILPIYDAGAEADLLYLVMEHVPGGRTARGECREGSLLPIPKVLEVIYKCCRALEYAHSRGVVHRDVKSSNILLTEEDDVRLADFGIAQLMRNTEGVPGDGCGTPAYMSPEQIDCQPISYSTDIYSLGVVMYELLTGRCPFEAPNLAVLIKRILADEPPLLSQLNPEVPGYLEPIVKTAMSKNVSSRYPTALAFAAAIERGFRQHRDVLSGSDASRQEKFAKLKRLKFFRAFLDSEIAEIIDTTEWQELPAGAVVIAEGDLDTAFYIIVSGRVQVRREGRFLSNLGPGDGFGEMAYFTKKRRSATIVADEAVTLVKISSTLMEQSSTGCQLRFLRTFLSALIERLSSTSSRLAELGG